MLFMFFSVSFFVDFFLQCFLQIPVFFLSVVVLSSKGNETGTG